jgi:hypothetical protein
MKHFNFSKDWQRIIPLLEDKEVQFALNLGMAFENKNYKPGDAPYMSGRGILAKVKPKTLIWYQPEGRCHWILPFSFMLGRKIYPNMKSGILSGKLHSIGLLFKDDWQKPEWLLDILLFNKRKPKESFSLASLEGEFFPTLLDYLSSFCSDRKIAKKALRTLNFNY